MKYQYDYVRIRDRYFPLIPINLVSNKISVNTLAYLDSGASVSLFRIDIANQMNIDIEKGEKVHLEGISGKITVYIHEVKVIVDDIEFILKVGFSEEYVASFNLLGRENFFSNFLITFDETKKKIILEVIGK